MGYNLIFQENFFKKILRKKIIFLVLLGSFIGLGFYDCYTELFSYQRLSNQLQAVLSRAKIGNEQSFRAVLPRFNKVKTEDHFFHILAHYELKILSLERFMLNEEQRNVASLFHLEVKGLLIDLLKLLQFFLESNAWTIRDFSLQNYEHNLTLSLTVVELTYAVKSNVYPLSSAMINPFCLNHHSFNTEKFFVANEDKDFSEIGFFSAAHQKVSVVADRAGHLIMDQR